MKKVKPEGDFLTRRKLDGELVPLLELFCGNESVRRWRDEQRAQADGDLCVPLFEVRSMLRTAITTLLDILARDGVNARMLRWYWIEGCPAGEIAYRLRRKLHLAITTREVKGRLFHLRKQFPYPQFLYHSDPAEVGRRQKQNAPLWRRNFKRISRTCNRPKT